MSFSDSTLLLGYETPRNTISTGAEKREQILEIRTQQRVHSYS